jgi:hypothetical protein
VQPLQSKERLELQIVTKFDVLDMLLGSSDAGAFRYLFQLAKYKKYDVRIHIVANLHAKAIILGTKAAILGSANVTFSGLNRNRELGIGILAGDEKIQTITRKIMLMPSRELSEDQFLGLYNAQKVFLGKKAEALSSIVRALKEELRQGLEGFAVLSSTGKRASYFDVLVEFLDWIGQKGRSRAEAYSWLRQRSKKQGAKINDRRLGLLATVGIITVTGESVEDQIIARTSMGDTIARGGKAGMDTLLLCLSGCFPEFDLILGSLTSNTWVHAEDLAKPIDGQERDLSRGTRFFQDRLRWLEAMGRVESQRRGRRVFYKLVTP